MTATGRPGFMRIADIKIGERHRKDFGDIDGLARNIAEIGPALSPSTTVAYASRNAGWPG